MMVNTELGLSHIKVLTKEEFERTPKAKGQLGTYENYTKFMDLMRVFFKAADQIMQLQKTSLWEELQDE